MKALTGLLAFVVLGTILGEDISEKRTQSTAATSDGECVNFAGDLYYRVQRTLSEGEDFAISPVGVSSLLGTLLFAVGQNSARQISNVLYPKCESANEADLSRRILQLQGSHVTMATVALVRRGVTVDKQFEEQAEKLGAFVYKTSFWSYTGDFNEFVFQKTNDRSFFATESLLRRPPNATTRLLFYNRLRYSAQFVQKFSERDGKLFAPRVQALHAHVPELKARVLGLPLRNTTSFLLILLPEPGSHLKTVGERLRKVDVRKLPSKLKATTMDITLDKLFEKKYLFLRDVLMRAGVRNVFLDASELSAFNGESELDDVLAVAGIHVTGNGVNTGGKRHYIQQADITGAYPEFKGLSPLIYAVVDSERVYVMGRQF